MATTSISIAPADPESQNFSNGNDENGFDENENEQDSTKSGANNRVAEMGLLISDTDDAKDGVGEEITFPESSHSFLFTESVTSIPFFFSLVIATMSYLCLIIAFIDNFNYMDIPVNVTTSVRVAQYMGILVALLMEEEIPTALFLLKRISKPMLQNQFPEINYWKFVASSILRFSMGYLFLANVVLILVQASEALEIFYDVLALQFLQQLDDIAFSVSKMEVFGKRMYLATTTPYFATGFKRQRDRFGIGRKIKTFLKAVYLINLLLFLAVMGFVSVKQSRGVYHCESFTVQIGTGNEVWGEAYVHYPENSAQHAGGKILVQPLDFSFFNGYYRLDESRTSEGRPIYIEYNKYDRTPFDKVVPKFNTSVMPYTQKDPIKPAEFVYCGGRWLLTHDYIKKSMHEADGSSDCGSWLLRSQPYSGFDLGGASGDWQIWEGEILPTDVSLTCTRCEDNADCNLNGVCNNNGECECKKEDGVSYSGERCEIKLKDECRNITAPGTLGGKSIWSTESIEDGVWEGYSRPVYTYMEGLSPEESPEEGDGMALVFSGSRYFITGMHQRNNNAASAFWTWQIRNFHGFWAQAFRPPGSYLISEPTRSDTPVGVNFFWVGEQQEEYGPFGKLIPVQEHSGLGLFRCDVTLNPCQFCSNGITADPSFIVPSTGSNCSGLEAYAKTSLSWKTENDVNHGMCLLLQSFEELCCPAEWAASVNASSQVP